MDSSSMHRCTCRGLTKSIGLQYSCSSNITLKTESVPEMPSGPDEAPRTDAPCHSWPGKRKVELEWGLEKHSRIQWVFTSCVLVSNIVKRLGGVLPLQFLCFGSKKCWKASHPFSSGQTNVTSPLCKSRSSAVEMLQKMQIERCWVKVVASNKESFRPPQQCKVAVLLKKNRLLQDSERIHSCGGNLNSLDTRRQEVWLWGVWCLNRVLFINILDMPGRYQMRLRAPQMLRKSSWSLRKQDCWLLCGKMGKWACLSSLLELIELPSDSSKV